MKIGLFGVNMGSCVDPTVIVRAGQLAEELQYESIWVGEHLVLPNPRAPDSPLPPDVPILDPLVTLAHLGAVTSTIRLATGVIILPLRHPVVLAKQIASLDSLSGGRVVLGVGAGYVQREFDSLGIPLDERGPRLDENLEVMRRLWLDEQPRFSGTFTTLEGVDAHPRPTQPAGPPIHIGGRSPAAFRRAVRTGQGWYGFNLDLDQTTDCLAGLSVAGNSISRNASLGRLEITVSPREPLTPRIVEQYAELGVDRLVLLHPLRHSTNDLLRFIEEHAPAKFIHVE